MTDQTNGDYNVEDLLGLGSHSVRKNYYPALLERLADIEAEKNRYKWLFDNALHGIFQADLRGGLLSCNPAMAGICGYASADALTDAIIRLREQLFCSVKDFDDIRLRLLSEGRVQARETRLIRQGGGAVDVAITLLRRPDLGPEVVEAFVADITERKQARERLERINVELEARVNERTRELRKANDGLRREIGEREKIEAELVIAMRAAEEANRSKDKYLAAASHDLLQPLNAARLLVSTLQDRALPPDEHHLIDRVHRALEGAEDLLADLLDISKLDQQAIQPDFTYVAVDELIQGLAGEFEPVAEHAGLRLKVRSRGGQVRTDVRMMTRILRNLLANAFRYTREGGVFLNVRVREGLLHLEVWDSGVGIPDDRLEDIFREFHQLAAPHTGGRKGVGLGLAIVDRMVRMLGHRIEVKSRPGVGSRFSIVLPLEQPRQMASPSPARFPAMDAHALDGRQVLVIDNEPDILVSMRALLEQWGCEVMTAEGADEALAEVKASGQLPEAILADYHLNDGRTGCEVIYGLRRSLGEDIPAAIITADRSDACRRFLKTQYFPVLNKPVKPNRLRALLTSLLGTAVS
ncbi:ATP-binding protein [Marinobacter nanhaiticus D15-8W]|uniref:histidine kinase n=1 Tax=Marinobacter nanhaiticus D15-8W TaxID=626887 RepID=N6W752_9GAMM|nr:NahK/ErcS family hybrid sensor histidine kinase/response regulator [Marinobacter nanhaiticus]ENO16069.1 PAS domain S-box protein [Marinobacter nanhaiticus D15-8W]BES73074.1 ATP-binding protein [Marinobacter nanhaiticus D15-8W]